MLNPKKERIPRKERNLIRTLIRMLRIIILTILLRKGWARLKGKLLV